MLPADPSVLIEIVGRIAVIYVALLVMLRVAGRRSLSDITPMDMLVLLLVSETVSPALTAQDSSLVGGLVAAATLIALSVLASWASFRWRGFERAVAGTTATLIRDGVVDEAARKRYRITDDDLATALHQGGVADPADVYRAFVEPDGKITVVKRDDS